MPLVAPQARRRFDQERFIAAGGARLPLRFGARQHERL